MIRSAWRNKKAEKKPNWRTTAPVSTLSTWRPTAASKDRRRTKIKVVDFLLTQHPWVTSIPLNKSAHGKGHYQKRLWRLVTDYCRIRDFYNFNRECIATGQTFNNWNQGDAGHFKSYALCNGRFKFDPINIHLQKPLSNKISAAEEGYTFGINLQSRYGEGILDIIEQRNAEHHNKQFTDLDAIGMMVEILELMASLPEQPDYYTRVVARRTALLHN